MAGEEWGDGGRRRSRRVRASERVASPTEPGENELVATLDDVVIEGKAGGRRPSDPTSDQIASDEELRRFATELGLTFRDLSLLRLALTHRSVLHDVLATGTISEGEARASGSNERLEFLGDAVLGAITADYLFRHDPEASEGTLTSRRVALVRAETLVGWAREIGLGARLRLGTGERVSESARDRMLAGAFEALVGAIWVDAGYVATRRFLKRFIDRDAEAMLDQHAAANPKGRLQEVLQERYRRSPVYRTTGTEGPDHARVFTVEVDLSGKPLGVGVGGSKREAQQAAAAAAIALLDAGLGPPAESPEAPS